MTGQLCTVLAGCVLAMIFGTSTARALGGRITFTGAIATPTCSAGDSHIDSLVAGQSGSVGASAQFACPSASNAPASEATTYSLSVASLDAVTTGHDRLLEYFVGYLNAAGAGPAQAKLVTQSFA